MKPDAYQTFVFADARHWIAVASAEHVRIGRAQGFMQICHGKRGPLARVQPGDGVVYYSPTTSLRGADRLRCFTAHGIVRPGVPHQVEISGVFRPFRREVDWFPGVETPIEPLLHVLEFTSGRRNWGYQMRFGLFGIGADDFARIAEAMTGGTVHDDEARAKAAVPSTVFRRGTDTPRSA